MIIQLPHLSNLSFKAVILEYTYFSCKFKHSVDYSLTHSLSARARFEKSLQLASCYLLINAEGKRGTTDPVFCVNKHSFQCEQRSDEGDERCYSPPSQAQLSFACLGSAVTLMTFH